MAKKMVYGSHTVPCVDEIDPAGLLDGGRKHQVLDTHISHVSRACINNGTAGLTG